MLVSNSSSMDWLLFAVTATLVTLLQQKKASASATATDNVCTAVDRSALAASLKNRAFVFVKPHANLPSTQRLVKDRLTEVGLAITAEGDIDGATIDEKKLIDQHYYAIGKRNGKPYCFVVVSSFVASRLSLSLTLILRQPPKLLY
jgi:hypothetical protein